MIIHLIIYDIKIFLNEVFYNNTLQYNQLKNFYQKAASIYRRPRRGL